VGVADVNNCEKSERKVEMKSREEERRKKNESRKLKSEGLKSDICLCFGPFSEKTQTSSMHLITPPSSSRKSAGISTVCIPV
jgi:hypothetical protein